MLRRPFESAALTGDLDHQPIFSDPDALILQVCRSIDSKGFFLCLL